MSLRKIPHAQSEDHHPLTKGLTALTLDRCNGSLQMIHEQSLRGACTAL
jgi:hypothetical protein